MRKKKLNLSIEQVESEKKKLDYLVGNLNQYLQFLQQKGLYVSGGIKELISHDEVLENGSSVMYNGVHIDLSYRF